MPEVLLRYRNKYEKEIYQHEPKREPGTGDIENFRKFISPLLKKPTKEFFEFHQAISQYNMDAVREYQSKCKNEVFHKWLKWYIAKEESHGRLE